MFADITIFDPAAVHDNADYAPGTSSLPSEGFVHVLVNGEAVVRDGILLENTFPGVPIRGNHTAQ
jgi:N-acyl-D-aspartate/D-glutamate deacylase